MQKSSSVKSVSNSFSKVKSLCKAKTLLKDAGIIHDQYSFYTTLNRVKTILLDRRLWLTRLNSEKFDDRIEHKKYGDPKEQKRLFIRCFSFSVQESAAMWGLYCPPTYQAIRVSFTKDALEQLLKQPIHKIESGVCRKESLEVIKRNVGDIVYASVNGEGDANCLSNSLYWNGYYTKNRIEGMECKKDQKTITGFVKDSEWKFENESRLFVKTREIVNSEHIAIDVPDETINGMSFTLSPWMDNDETDFVNALLVKWIKVAGRTVSFDNGGVIRRSTLSGGLERWKERRGL